MTIMRADIHQPMPLADLGLAGASSKFLKKLALKSRLATGKKSIIIPMRAIRLPISFQSQIWSEGGKGLPPCKVAWNQSMALPMAAGEKWSPLWMLRGMDYC